MSQRPESTGPVKRALLISFDLISEAEPPTSFAIGCLLSFLKTHWLCRDIEIEHVSFNLLQTPTLSPEQALRRILSQFGTCNFDTVAISCYIWAESLINPIIAALRRSGFAGRIVLGGNQIHYSSSLDSDYPDAQVFVRGFGELSLLRALTEASSTLPRILNEEVDLASLPSPYLNGTIPVSQNQRKVRTETKRGCPYRCSFCAHRDLEHPKVYPGNRETTIAELKFLSDKNVNKINIVDPVFNIGHDYLWILEQIATMGAHFRLSLQCRADLIRGAEGARFLDLCKALNVCLEFGLQSIIPSECLAINRRNDLDRISHVFRDLNRRQIDYEVTLIYGLPTQTVRSFQESVSYLQGLDCPKIRAFPLMLLRGTELWAQKQRWGYREEPNGPYHIPVTVESNTFTRDEWVSMKLLADALNPAEQV